MAGVKVRERSLMSVVQYKDRGPYGSNKYRGNCSGYLVRDLLTFFEPRRVLDPMEGSGTTSDVCRELGIEYVGLDLSAGFDLMADEVPCGADFVFWHPPYHDIIRYSGEVWGTSPDPRDLSRCPDWRSFIDKLDRCQEKLMSCLRRGGTIAILVGDIKRRGMLFSMAKDLTWLGQPSQILIKTQENCTSSTWTYTGRFIPIVHEYCLVFKRNDCYVLSSRKTTPALVDLREQDWPTWRDVVQAALEALDAYQGHCAASLDEIYSEVEGHKRTCTNPHWKEKVRQVLGRHADFANQGRGLWSLAA